MSQYQKWATKPIEIEEKGNRDPKVRIPTLEEWKIILERFGTINSLSSIINHQSSIINHQSSIINHHYHYHYQPSNHQSSS
jgi:hypothetical protein